MDNNTPVKRLKQDLSDLFETISFMEQNDNFSSREIEIINEQLSEIQSDVKNTLNDTRLHKQINQFINAIKRHTHNIDYFDNIKVHGIEMYQELTHNFNEGMIAQPLLYKYFNIVYKSDIFPDNKLFLKILKNKDDMFNIDPETNPRYKRRKRYKIIETKPKRIKRFSGGIRFVKKLNKQT